MKNESFERAKILKEEIEKCNSLLESILKSSKECFVNRDAVRTSGDIAVITLPKYCTQYIIDGLYVKNADWSRNLKSYKSKQEKRRNNHDRRTCNIRDSEAAERERF